MSLLFTCTRRACGDRAEDGLEGWESLADDWLQLGDLERGGERGARMLRGRLDA